MGELYVNNNGTILPANNPTIQTGSRAFLYGDGLFETIRIIKGIPIDLQNHFDRLMAGSKAIRLRIPAYFTFDFFKNKIEELIQKSQITEGGKCRFSLDRSEGGTYLPEVNEVSYYIEVLSMPTNYFEVSTKGLEIDLLLTLHKQNNFLAKFKTKNALLNVMATILANEKGLDDFLITNEKGTILESSNSNIFIVSNGVLYTPALEDGCVAGTMRKQIIALAIENKMRVYECNISPQNLLAADEVFLTNAIKGIVWVGGYRTKRYENMFSRRMVSLLNNYWKKKLENEV